MIVPVVALSSNAVGTRNSPTYMLVALFNVNGIADEVRITSSAPAVVSRKVVDPTSSGV